MLYKIAFIILFVVGATVRTVSLAKTSRWWKDKDKTAENRQPVSENLLMIPVFLGMQVAPVVYILSSWLDFADYNLPIWGGRAAAVLGVLSFLLAIWLLWRSHVDLGQNFSPELKIKAEHRLITTGIFKSLRHPMYSAHWFWALGQALLLQNWIAGPAFLIAFLPFYLVRVPREEAMLMEYFGEEYSRYMKITGRIFPKIFK